MEGIIKKTALYYTDSRLEPLLANCVMGQIRKAAGDMPIISVSQKPLAFGQNIFVGMRPRSYLGLYQQVQAGLEEIDDDTIVYLCEHDVFYHESHFRFMPPEDKKIYFNMHRYYFMRNKKYFLKAVGQRALSQCVSHKPVLYEHICEQVEARVKNDPILCHGPFAKFSSPQPNIDIRHGGNFSVSSRFEANEKSPRILEVPYWGTPRMFQAKTDYKNEPIYTNIVLREKLNPTNRKSPVILENFTRNKIVKLFKQAGARSGAEIGVKKGKFSKFICETVPDVRLLCVDHYPPDPRHAWDDQEENFATAKGALKEYNVEHIKKPSVQAADEVPKNSLDFVYIDASHYFNDFMQDLILWTDRVRRGGIVAGHDYDLDDNGEGVKDAVDAYCRHHGIELYLTTNKKEYPDNVRSWFFAKGQH